jgi:5'-nucleotidase (lipoprotein e(P4) family)
MIRAIVSISLLCLVFGLTAAPPTSPTYENLNSVLWVQTSVEYRASATQTYHLAEIALRHGLRNQHWTAALEQNGGFESLPPAVILDLDETVLDNSVFNARLVASDKHYSEQAWTSWVNEHDAGLVPGAMDFLQFAHANGVMPIYITNRLCDTSREDDPTVKMLRSLGAPLERAQEQLLCAQTSKDSDKTSRREKCVTKFRILLLFGDQLGDFLQIPPGMTTPEGRQKLFDAHRSLWGERWFQLPNPMYGSWEESIGYDVKKDKLPKLKQ